MHFLRNLLFTAISFSVFAGPAFSADKMKEVATVNGVSLLEPELVQEIQVLLPLESAFHSGVSPEKMKTIRGKALTNLVERELKYQDALTRGMKLTKAELKKEIDRISGNMKGGGDFAAQIAAGGFSPDSFDVFVERLFLSKKVKEMVVDDKVKISDAMVTDYYEKNKSRYMKPEEFKASHILIKVDPSLILSEKEKAKAKAESLLKQLREGADFAELAAKESDDLSGIKGGELGSFHAGQVVPEFEAAVKALKPGEISDVIETIYGFHIIKLHEKKTPHLMSFEEVKSRIKEQLHQEEETRLYNEWLEGLKAKAKISYPKEG